VRDLKREVLARRARPPLIRVKPSDARLPFSLHSKLRRLCISIEALLSLAAEHPVLAELARQMRGELALVSEELSRAISNADVAAS
jgi:hypothetical protein